MQRGFAFKLMAPKEIAHVLGMIGVHPAVTPENIDRPNAEIASNIYQHLASFAYDVAEIQHVKGRASEVHGVGPYAEIFDEGMDVIAIFKLARKLASINRIEDFSMKDMWDPQAKRFRAILSGVINFCRYKESQTAVMTTMKQDVQVLESARLELVDKSNAIVHELTGAQSQHSAELETMRVAENELQDATSVVDKLEKEKQTADRLHETADTGLESAKERLAQKGERAQQLRDDIAALQEQVAESPEGLEQEIQELQLAIRQQKASVEEKTDEKRAQMQRVQVLARIDGHLDQYKGVLEKVEQSAVLKEAACDRSLGARNELGAMRSSLDACRTEELELVQFMEQIKVDMDVAKQAHDDQVRQFEERRQQAMGQQQELQGKRTDEQRQWSELQAHRTALETDIANVKRAHEADMNDLESRVRTTQDGGAEYVGMIDGLMTQYDAEAGRSMAMPRCSPTGMRSPGSARSWKAGSFNQSPGLKPSPAPRRLVMDRSGY